jgi:hypothetical protein
MLAPSVGFSILNMKSESDERGNEVTTALAVTPRLTPDVMTMILSVAPTMHEARLFGTKSAQQAAAIMIKGYELGFSLSASFENIYMIEEKPSLSPRGALALIYNSPECAGVKIVDEVDSKGAPSACVVTMKRRNGLEYTSRFTMEDAKRAGLVKDGSGWTKYPANMLRYRAIGYAADIVFPDVIGGTKRADEYGADLTQDGDVIEGSWSVQQNGSQPAPNIFAKPAVTVSQPDPSKRLNSLLESYGAEQIMRANGGRIPATNEDLDKVENELAITGGK